MNAIELTGLTKRYGDFTLDNISLSLPQGTILGLVGENGAGKTTTLEILSGILKRDSGDVKVLGADPLTFPKIKEQIGIVLDEVGIPDDFKVNQVNKVMEKAFKSWDSKRFHSLINELDIPDNKKFKDFSRGNKMKLGLAIAFSHNPKLLILDEATNGLDPIARSNIEHMLMEFTRDETNSVIISSHIVSELENICDYIAFIHEGKLMLFEEKDRLLEKYGIHRCTKEEFKDIPKEAALGVRENPFGCEVLIDKSIYDKEAEIGRISIEDVFLYMADKERQIS